MFFSKGSFQWLFRALLFLVSVFALLLICNGIIVYSTHSKVFTHLKEVPYNKVGVVLGTAKYARKGGVNPFYKYRVDAAVQLYKAKKIKYILVSGDNATKSYNEPQRFKDDLLKRGIPESKIILDYAGFRTLDSMVRAYKVFGQESFTVISQFFHNQRAVYLAESFGINAIGYAAKEVSFRYATKVYLREYLARVKVFLDLLLGIGPRYLGDPITIT